MATKKEQYELAITQSYLIDILQSNDFSDENMEKSRMMLKKLQENYSFREDDFYHPHIAREEEIKSALKKVQMAGQRPGTIFLIRSQSHPYRISPFPYCAAILRSLLIHFAPGVNLKSLM